MPGRRHLIAVGLALIFGAGLALRLVGLAYGLPAIYNPDEVAILNRALGLAQTGFDPRNFLYPSLYFYVLFLWEGLWFLVGRVAGVFPSLAAFERAFFVDATTLVVAGRLLTALCGVLTIIATWWLGRRLFGPRAGWVAALLMAVAPLAVRDAHYIKHDVPVTLLIVLTHVVIATDAFGRRDRPRPALAGALAGLAISTHYYAVFVVAPVALVALLPAAPDEPVVRRLRRLGVAALAAMAAFALGSPFLVADPATAWRDIVANREIVMDRVTGATGAFGSLPYYAEWLRRDAIGALPPVLAVAGLVAVARRGWVALALASLFPVLFLAFIANTYPASRYLNPILPFIAVLAGIGVERLTTFRSRMRATAALLASLVLAIAVGQAAAQSLRTDLFFREADTRTIALDWITANVPDGASILVQPYSVPLRQSRAGLVEALTANLGSPDRASVRFQRQLALSPYPAPAYRTIYLGEGGLDADKIYVPPSLFAGETLEPLRRLGVSFVVLKRYNVPDQPLQPLIMALQREGRLAVRVSPYPAGLEWSVFTATAPFLHNTDVRIAPILERPGPIVEVWTIP